MKKKNILFLSYWSLREPLTAAAIFPYLHLLSEMPDVERIHLVTFETSQHFLPEVVLDIDKVVHHGIRSRFTWSYALSKVDLQVHALHYLSCLVRKEKIDILIAKSSLAGNVAHLVHLMTGVRYIVESYEPHSTYMLGCGVWTKRDPRYLYANMLEKAQLKHAEYLVTVTHNHREDLIKAGQSPHRIKTIPSITDTHVFRFQEAERARVRSAMNIPQQATVGIYVGKFGGLYYDDETYVIFRHAFEQFPGFHLIILSPSDTSIILKKVEHSGLPMDRVHLATVPHKEIPAYLSASDIAFSTIRPSTVNRYQSPVKNGEYWANGLPIFMTDGIADEYRLMRKGIGGHVFNPDMSDLKEAMGGMASIISREGHRFEIAELAKKYKSIDLAKEVYAEIFG